MGASLTTCGVNPESFQSWCFRVAARVLTACHCACSQRTISEGLARQLAGSRANARSASEDNSPPIAQLGGGGCHRVNRDPGETTADAHALAAGLNDLGHGKARSGEDVEGFGRRAADRPDLTGAGNPRRVENVRPG